MTTLWGIVIGETEIHKMIEDIKSSGKLCFPTGSLTKKACQILIQFLESDSSLIEVNLSNIIFRLPGTQSRLFKCLKNHTSLKSFTSHGGEILGESFALECGKTLEYLSLSYNNFDKTDSLTKILAPLEKTTSLRELYLDGNRIDEKGMEVIVSIITNNPNLNSLRITNMSLTDTDYSSLYKALGTNTTLDVLYIGGYDFVADETFSIPSSISYLNLTLKNLSQFDFKVITEHPNLTGLHLDVDILNKEGVYVLNNLLSSIKKLDNSLFLGFRSIRIFDSGPIVRTIIRTIISNRSLLASLEALSFTKFGGDKITIDVQDVIDIIRNGSALKYLNLSFYQIKPEEFLLLLETLRNDTTLEKFQLSGLKDKSQIKEIMERNHLNSEIRSHSLLSMVLPLS